MYPNEHACGGTVLPPMHSAIWWRIQAELPISPTLSNCFLRLRIYYDDDDDDDNNNNMVFGRIRPDARGHNVCPSAQRMRTGKHKHTSLMTGRAHCSP
jgi:hypothetical protein